MIRIVVSLVPPIANFAVVLIVPNATLLFMLTLQALALSAQPGAYFVQVVPSVHLVKTEVSLAPGRA